MSIAVGDRRRFHNDGREPGSLHTVTRISNDRVHYVYDFDPTREVWWPLVDAEEAGGYEECTELVPNA